jgi:metallo-beta-lactamase family protein
MEATYGNRSHAPEAAEEGLAAVVSRTLERGGVVLIPTFAVGRAQAILLLLHRLRQERRIPGVPVFLDSPMAIRASEVHLAHAEELRPEPGELTRALNAAEWVRTSEESKALNRRLGPMVILAGSGMLTGGRILHHLQHYGGRHENLLILVGYQAEGTRGRELRRGERSLRMHGRWFDVRCQVEALELLSGHADREELLEWAAAGAEPELGVSLVHGEPGPADHLRRRLVDRTGWRVEVAREGVPLLEEEVS